FHGGTTFPHSLCSGRGPGVRPPPEMPYFFRRNHFSSCRPAEPVRLEATREIGFARLDRHTIFEGTTFPPSFRPRLAQQEARTLGGEGTAPCISREPLSLIPLGFTYTRWPRLSPTLF